MRSNFIASLFSRSVFFVAFSGFWSFDGPSLKYVFQIRDGISRQMLLVNILLFGISSYI